MGGAVSSVASVLTGGLSNVASSLSKGGGVKSLFDFDNVKNLVSGGMMNSDLKKHTSFADQFSGKDLLKTVANPVGAVLGEGNIVSKALDPIPGSFIHGQTGINGIIDDPIKGIKNAAGVDMMQGVGKSLLHNAEDLFGGIGDLVGGGDGGGEGDALSTLDSGGADGTQDAKKRILRGGGSRRRKGFAGGSTSLAPSTGQSTLLGS